MRQQHIRSLIAAAFILVFGYTGFSKLRAIEQFQDVLWQAPFFGRLAPAVAWTLPIVELVIVALLLFPSTLRWGLYASLALVILFLVYFIYMFLFASHLPCQCGGVISQLGWREHLLLNLCLAGLAIWGLCLEHRHTDSLKEKKGCIRPQ